MLLSRTQEDVKLNIILPNKKAVTLSIGSWPKRIWLLKEISIFYSSTWNLYLRDITFVTDVSVPTIETIKLVFKPVFLKQFYFLKPALDIFMTLLK